MIIRLEKPTLRRKDMDAVLQTMADEQIGVGDHTFAFTTLLQQKLNRTGYTTAVRDRVHALYYALIGMGITEGSVVGISALSPRFYGTVVTSLGASVEIFDIDPTTGNVAYEDVAIFGFEKLDGIILYEPYGCFPITEHWNSVPIPLIEDITESFGSTWDDTTAGMSGDIVISAFEESSIVSTAGGAAIMTEDSLLAQRIESAIEPCYHEIALPGMNAALGVVQLSQMERNLEKRRAIFDRYRHALMKTRHALFGISHIEYGTNGYSFVVILDSKPEMVKQFALRYEVAIDLAFKNTVIGDNLEAYDRFPQAIPCVTRGVRFPLYPFLSSQDLP
jgi:dTDP-4-amino-4,6-dideoxygalactose transaminase